MLVIMELTSCHHATIQKPKNKVTVPGAFYGCETWCLIFMEEIKYEYVKVKL